MVLIKGEWIMGVQADDNIEEAKKYYNRGHDYFDKDQYDKAISWLEKIHRRSDPYYFNAQLLLGLSYSAKEEYEKAKEIYGSIPKNDPNYNEAQINLAKRKEPIDMFVSLLKWLGVVIDILVILVIIFFNIATIFPELFCWFPFIEDIKEINKTDIIRLNIILFAVFIGLSLFLYNVFNSHNDVFPKTITTFINLILCAIAGLIILFAIIVLIPSDTAIPSGVAVVSDVEVASKDAIPSDVAVYSEDASLTDEVSLFMVQITIFIALITFSFTISIATPYFMTNAKMENIKIEAKDEAKATASDIAKQQMENTKTELESIAKQQMENTKVEVEAIAKSTAETIAKQQMV